MSAHAGVVVTKTCATISLTKKEEQRKRTSARRISMKKAARLTAKLIVAVQYMLLPLIIIAFTMPERIVAALSRFGVDFPRLPMAWIAEDQRAFLASRGLITPRVESALWLFSAFALLSIGPAALRLLSGPLLFDVADWRTVLRKNNSSIPRFLIGWLFMSSGVWWALDIRTTLSTHLRGMVKTTTTAYVAFETFMFVCAVICFVEGLLGCIQIAFTQQRVPAPG
jgi:hypothetical protein